MTIPSHLHHYGLASIESQFIAVLFSAVCFWLALE